MIPAFPDADLADIGNFKEAFKPTRWENLGGPFGWLDWDDTVHRDREDPLVDKYGPYVYAGWYGPIGQMVSTFSKRQVFPDKSYLFSGPRGIGKTALIKLMAFTILSNQHMPVRFNDGVIVLDPETDEPYIVNPVAENGIGFDTIQYAINHPGDTSSNIVESHNAGMMYKDDVNKVAESISRTFQAFGRNRVIILNEFDNVGSRQVPALKGAMDPGGGIPDGLLILADTNYPEKVKKSMGKAGMDRFNHLAFTKWPTEDLCVLARRTLTHFGVEFDLSTFEPFYYGAVQKGDTERSIDQFPAQYIAELADGTPRHLYTYIESVCSFDRPVTIQDVDEVTTEDMHDLHSFGTFEDGDSQLIDIFFNRVVTGRSTSVQVFTKQALDRKQSLTNFVNRLVYRLYQRESDRVIFTDSNVHSALVTLWDLSKGNEGHPMKSTRWAAATRPLLHIAKALS
mgnify:CR=1 FL=1